MHTESSASPARSVNYGLARFRRDVLKGLSGVPKSVPSKYFYDAMGSALFDRICDLDEYYLTRAEIEIMERYVEEMVELLGPRCMLVEFGSGNSVKTEILLDHLERPVAYVPIDISDEYLRASTERLRGRYPALDVLPIAADYTVDLALPETSRRPDRTIVYFPGSTIGNFDRSEAADFLARIADVCGPQGGLLIGVDLKKDAATLELAYNDRAGVTAAFNLNLLARSNRELGSDFDLGAFEHRAIYDPEEGRIEMLLVSKTNQDVQIGDVRLSFLEGEPIRTEYSYKYSILEFAALAREAGFRAVRTWTDAADYFSVHYLEPI